MRAVVCPRYGPPDVLRLEERPTPVPRPDEVRIRIRATAVTSSDCYTRGLRLSPTYRLLARLVLGWRGPRQPVLGMVLSGEVDAVGREVRTFEVGDQVLGFDRHRFGTYAEQVCWRADGILARRPESLSDVDAAALTYGGLLAAHLLRKGGVVGGQSVLVYGASGAVGTAVVQLAREAGAEVTGVCGPTNLELVTSLGASTVVDYTTTELTQLPGRYDAILDAVGKRKSSAALRGSERLLRPGGRRVSIDDGAPGCAGTTWSGSPASRPRAGSEPSSTARTRWRRSSRRTGTWTPGTSAATSS